MTSKLGKLQYEEPPMFLQRPTSGSSQDVTHILASTFRDLFTRDFVEQESVRNLNKSRTGEDSYHEKYVEELRKVQVERERRMAEAAMLERHIMQARAKSMAEDERELNKAASDCDVYHNLGLPPVQSSFKHCLDSNLLRKHGLIVPEDFSTQEPPLAHAPKAANQPHYAEATQTSTKRVMSADKEHAQVRQDHALEIQKMMAQKSKKKVVKKEKWQETLTPETREMHRKDLTIVYKKSDFLRNPRHRPPSQTEGKRSLVKANTVSHQLGGAKTTVIDEDKEEPSVVFLATPLPVVFSTYQVGHVYEALLNLKNVSAASRPLRVRPPKSQHFAVGLGKFPGEQGMVAPGMSCQYNIRFMPDSLMNFEDELIIQTQSAQPLTVKLLGQRAPPILTLSSVIDCGFCLIGGEVTREFIVKNEGGSGRFCAMPRDCWPASSFKSVSSGDKTELPPFVIQPAMFELQAGHAISLYVTFMPREAALFEKSITIVCDNCTVKHFNIKGIGQTAGVLLKSVTGGESPPLLGDLQDISAQHHIKFKPVNPLTMDTKHIVIQNTTNVELPYYWQSFRPIPINPKPRDTIPEEEEAPSNDEMLGSIRQPDNQLVFHVNPQNGIVPPGGKVKATVCFAPPQIGSFISVLQLILQNIPSTPDNHDQSSSSGEKLTQTPSKKHSQPQAQPLVDTSALEIEVRGECEEFDVMLHPYAIIVPGQILVSTTVRKQVMMTNYSQYPAFFKWDTVSDCHIIEIQPNQGQIPGRSTIDLEATITGGRVGQLEKTVLCHIESQPKPLALKVHASIKGPAVVIDTSAIDFGLIQFGSSVSAKVIVRNESQVAASFKLRESPEFVVQNPSTGESQSELILSKEGGELGPLGSEVISVIFRPLLCRKISSVMECIVRDGSDCFIPVHADVQRPQACLLNCMITLKNAFRGVPTQYQAVLINQTLLPTKFEWQKPVGPQATSCEITLEPSHGILQPHEELKILVTLVADLEGHISNLLVPCSIEGMKHPVVMSIGGEVKGLKVTYTTPKEENTSRDSSDDLISIDFGTEMEVGSTPSRIVHIQNHTAITAPFSIALENFVAGKPPTPPESHKKRVDSPKRRGLLAPTANLADPKSKSSSQLQADYTKAILRENNGIAFTVEPATGMLQPFETLTIKVTAFSDMWGSYSDKLVCKVSDLAPVVIPVKATVIGCPLKFQMATLKGQIPVVRFGTHVCGVPPVQRPLKIVNNSPCDLRVDWRLFNLLEGDPTVLDLIVNIGNSFPLLDENGQEVEPPVVDYHTPQNTPKDIDDTTSESTFAQSQRAVDNNLLSHITEELEREAERKTSREKLVLVQLKEHEGNAAEGPFSINENQLIVPARSQVGIVTYFTPDVKYLSSLESTDCVGYALGYLSLVKETDKEKGEMVKRAETYDVDPLRLDFTANMKPAILKIETSEEEGMVYRTAASRLLQPTADSPQWTLHPSHCPTVEATMTNGTQTPLQFQLLAQEPFYLANLDPVPKRPGESRQKRRPFEEFKEDEMITLPSQKNVEISVAFRLTLDLINQSLHELQPDTGKDGLCLTSSEIERKLHVRKDLHICYNNGTVQKLPLYAVVTLPSLVITPEKMDFGTCLVGQQRSLEVTITNSTASASFWKGYLCSQDPTDDKGLEVFNISPSLGYLEAHVTHVSQSKAILKILFTARHDVSYEGVFLFSGLLGEETRKLTVTGQGSYDNRHEALVNV